MAVSPRPGASRTALVVYLSMLATVAITVITSATLQASAHFPKLGHPRVGLVPLVVALGVGLGVIALRDRMPARTARETEDEWWQQNIGRAIVIWTLDEGLALVGGVFYLLTGLPITLSSAALGLALLAFCTPSNLVNR